jgi:hypothetical protein
VQLTLAPDEDLVQVPYVSWPGPPPTQPPGEAPAEFLAPAPDSFIGDDNAPLGQK